jgi:ABC-type glycerol-3-phosphate transport system permease component
MRAMFGNKERLFNASVTTTLLIVSLVFVLPLFLTMVFATHSIQDVFQFPPPLWFGSNTAKNFNSITTVFPPLEPVINSLIVVVPRTIGLVLVSALAGYALARYTSAPGYKAMLALSFAAVFFPQSLSLIPFFLQMSWLGWLDSFWPLVLPMIASGFGVIWMYTYITSAVPKEIYEATEMDGVGGIATFFFVVLPIIRPGLAALAVWTLISTWNEFQLPLVVINDAQKFTMPLALTTLSNVYFSDIPAVMLATVIGLIPVLALFALLSKQFIAGLTSGAVK